MLLTNIQDEMHRRAITYSRELNTRKNLKSELNNISGVGNVRKMALMNHFKSVKRIASASLSELMSVKSMDKTTAENVWNYFNNGRETDDIADK